MQYETRVVRKRSDHVGARFSAARRRVRDLLSAARTATGEAQELLWEQALGVRLPHPDYRVRWVSWYSLGVSWWSTRTVITTRERVEAALERSASRLGERHLRAISRRGSWVWRSRRWRRWKQVIPVDTARYHALFRALLGSWMVVRPPLARYVARRFVALLDDAEGAITLGPSNRWCGPERWDRSWLVEFLDANPDLAGALRRWVDRALTEPRPRRAR